MENLELILSIVASLLGIYSAITSFTTKQEVKKMKKNSNNTQHIGNNNSGITQTQNIGDGR